ncbi:MAG TPA: hypothetical protein VM618_09460 [Acidimicrobiia bacterium]|nr:hypothetical protein [Acidimicrobiia bacterium]
MQRRLRTTIAIVVAALFGVGVAALTTGTDGGGDEVNLIAHAADAARDAGTGRMAFEMEISAPGEGTISIDGTGVFDGDRMQMVMAFPEGPDMPAGAEFEMRTIDTRFFIRFPSGLSPEEMPFPTPWVVLDLAKVDPELAGALTEEMMAGSDPSQTLEMLRGAGDDFETIGTEEVRGVSTTHYRVTVDMAKAVAEVPAEHRAAVERAMEDFREQLGSTLLPMDVWLDDAGLPRRMAMDFDFSALEGVAPGSNMRMTIDMFDYGTPVSVEEPPANEVTDISEMAEQFGAF